MPWKYNGQVVSPAKGFRKTDGVMTPRNWESAWDSDTKKAEGLTWEDPAAETQTDAEKLADLRDLRNAKLRDTDFYALSDQTLSNDMKTYRQSLRDITKTYQSMDAEGFAWPTEPS